MAGLGRPDVYIIESLAQSAPSLFPSVTPAAFVGYCRQGPVTPTLINSWNQFTQVYGPWTGTPDDALATQVYQFFNNGGGVCFVVRVLGAGSASATYTFQDRQGTPANILVVSADNPGAWGNNVFVEVVDTGITGRFNINVRVGVASNAPVERFLDLSMNPTDPRNAVNIINSSSTGSNFITVSTPNNWVYAPSTGIPIASTAGSGGTALSGGADSTSTPTLGAAGQIMTGVNSLSQGLAGLTGLLINLVGVTDTATINAAIAYVTARQDSFLIVDPALAQTSAQIVTTRQGYSSSSYAAMYWPNIWIGDPSSTTPGANKLVSPSGSVMGRYAVTDATRGVSKAPAGVNVGQLSGVVALETPAPQPSDYDIVSNGNVNGIRFFQNIGYTIWGSKTFKATQADSQISVRRTLMQIEQAIRQVTLFAVEDNNDETLWYEITEQVRTILQQLFQLKGLKGNSPSDAYFVVCDASNNTPQTIAAQELHVTVGVALQTPALFVIINVGQFAGSTASLTETLS